MQSTIERCCEITFAGQKLLLDPSGALFWPQERLLMVSDLHLEKGSFFARFGSLLPPYDTRDTLLRLERLIEYYQPAQIVCLGDSFHDAGAYNRLHTDDRNTLLRLITSVSQWHWILGNHDPDMAASLPGSARADLTLADIMLKHEPHAAGAAQIVGHFHPKLQLHMSGIRVSGKVFAVDSKLMIMPSFGSYTGGLDVRDPVYMPYLPSPRYYLLYRNQVWKI